MAAANILNNMSTDVLKVPLGFIRILEVPMTIISFASLVSMNALSSYSVNCAGKTKSVEFEWGYPFRLIDTNVPRNSCVSNTFTANNSPFHVVFSGQAEFFCFVGVISFLYCLAILAVYLFKWGTYENDSRLPKIDLIITALLAFFWFCGVIAWGAAISGLKLATNVQALEARLLGQKDVACVKASAKTDPPCTFQNKWSYGDCYISVIAGFGCFLLFAGNSWFIWKETEWFKMRQGPPANFGESAAGQPYSYPSGTPPVAQPAATNPYQ